MHVVSFGGYVLRIIEVERLLKLLPKWRRIFIGGGQRWVVGESGLRPSSLRPASSRVAIEGQQSNIQTT